MLAGKISRVWHGYKFSVGIMLGSVLGAFFAFYSMLMDGADPTHMLVYTAVCCCAGAWLLGVYNARRHPRLGSEVSYG